MKKLTDILFFVLIPAYSFCQAGSWSIVNAELNINEKWSLFGEAQIRSLSFYNHFHYYEFKGGASYNLGKNFSLTAGLGNYDTYAEGGNFKTPMVNDEFRTWIQLNMRQFLERIKFEHRYRAEQRFTLDGYRSRFRYRINMVIPLNKNNMGPKTTFISGSNEVFFTNRQPYFERNRLFLGSGYIFSDLFSIQIGYLRQFDYRTNDETGKNFFQVAFLFEFSVKKRKGETIPRVQN